MARYTIDLSTPPTDGQTLTYNAATGLWRPATPAAGGGSGAAIASTEPKALGIAAPGSTGQASDAGHIHPRVTPSAGTYDTYKAWTLDYMIGAGAVQNIAGAQGVNVGAMLVEADTVLSNVIMSVTTAATITTAGQCFAAIFDATGNRLAVSADISSLITTTGKKTFPMAAPTGTIVAGTVVYAGLLINGTGTTPAFSRGSTTTAILPATRFGTVAGSANATTMPASFVPGSLVVGPALWFAAN